MLAFVTKIWENGRLFFLVLACLFLLLWAKGCGTNKALMVELTACNSRPPVMQVVSGTAQARVIIKYVTGPNGQVSPCPDVDTSLVATVSASQEAPKGPICPPLESIGVWAGVGYFGAPMASLGVNYGPWKADGLIGIGTYGVQVQRKILSW